MQRKIRIIGQYLVETVTYNEFSLKDLGFIKTFVQEKYKVDVKTGFFQLVSRLTKKTLNGETFSKENIEF